MTALTNVTFSPGTVITSDWLNGINDALNFKTAVKVTRNTSQTINDVTYTKVQFNTEIFDSLNEFDSTTNNRWTCTTAGYYAASATLRLESATGVSLKLVKNGTTDLVISSPASATGNQTVSCYDVLHFNPGDYLEVQVYHNSGSSKNTTAGQEWTNFTIHSI